ncbi:hypothetical protein Efla_001323 [Eimeria flavescens]
MRRSSGLTPRPSRELCEPVDSADDYIWASDHEKLIAVLQLTRVFLLSVEPPSDTSSSYMGLDSFGESPRGQLYLIDFSDLRVRALSSDSLLNASGNCEQPRFLTYKAEPLLQMEQLMNLRREASERVAEGLEKAEQLIDPEGPGLLHQATAIAAKFSHPILWRLLADAALASEQLDVTEEAFVRSENYIGLQVLKRIRNRGSTGEGMPTMAALAGNILGAGAFYEAQQRYVEAAQVFLSFGYWKEAAAILDVAGMSQHARKLASSSEMYHSLSEACSDAKEWQLAIESYKKFPPGKGLLEALFATERYEELEQLTSKLNEDENTQLLLHAAHLLAAAGRGQAAAAAFRRAGRPQDAVDAAVRWGEWNTAVFIAREHCKASKLQEIAAAYKTALQHQQGINSEMHMVEAFMSLGIPEAAAQELSYLTH